MRSDRLDDLLELALRGERLPADLTSEERVEVERLLAARDAVNASREMVKEELRTSLPVARARFERFLASQGEAAGTPDGGRWRRRWIPLHLPALTVPRLAVLTMPAAVVVLLVVAGFVVLRTAFQDVEVAVALEEGDYVQAEGTIAEARQTQSGVDLRLDTPTGVLRVVADAATRIESAGREVDPSELVRGKAVVVDGLVGPWGEVRAVSVLVGSHRPAVRERLQALRGARAPVDGVIVLVKMAADGSVGDLVLETEAGRRLVVPVDGVSIEALLRRFSTALGERVRLVPVPGTRVFRVETGGPVDDLNPAPPLGGRPALVSVRGVVRAVEGDEIRMATAGGQLTVRLRPETVVVGRGSGLTPAELRERTAVVGHVVAVVGSRDPGGSSFLARLVIVGPAAAHPPD